MFHGRCTEPQSDDDASLLEASRDLVPNAGLRRTSGSAWRSGGVRRNRPSGCLGCAWFGPPSAGSVVEGLAALAGPCWTDWAGQRTAKPRLPMASWSLRFKSVDHSEPSRHRPNHPLANRLVGTPRHRAFGPFLFAAVLWGVGPC